MRAISTAKGYSPVAVGVESILNGASVLPEKVFREPFRFFLFITFDELFMPLFFNHLKRYLTEVGEEKFWVTAIDPDPKTYFGAHFDFFGAIEFVVSDTQDEYIAGLHGFPEDSPADSIVHNSNVLMYFSPTHKWALYGDRGADIAICAFTERWQMELFKTIYGPDLLDGVKAAADYAYGSDHGYQSQQTFCVSYSPD